MKIFDTPRTLVMNGVTFYTEDLVELQTLFPDLDMLASTAKDIRESDVLQKAILSGAIVSKFIQPQHEVILNLTQAGRALIGKI